MILKDRKKLLEELASGVNNPKEFIYGCMSLQSLTPEVFSKRADMTRTHFHVAINQLVNNGAIGIKTIVKISNGLDIDPKILNRVVADYKLNKYLNGINQNT